MIPYPSLAGIQLVMEPVGREAVGAETASGAAPGGFTPEEPAAPWIGPEKTDAERWTDRVAEDVARVLRPFYPELSARAVGAVISEALFHTRRRVLSGQEAHLEYLGRLSRIQTRELHTAVRFVADEGLMEAAR